MEMHLVHYKSTYGPDFATALANNNNTWDTIAVLGIMFQIQFEDNHDLDNIVNGTTMEIVRMFFFLMLTIHMLSVKWIILFTLHT